MGANPLPHHSDQEIDEILAEMEDTEPALSEENPLFRTELPEIPKTPETTDASNTETADEPTKKKKEVWSWLQSCVAAMLAAFFLFGVVFRFVTVEGASMQPSLHSGDKLIMSSLFCSPDPGDIVILSDKTGLGKPLIKRVIAVGGQELSVSGGQVLIDGEPLDEPYVAEVWKDSGAWRYPLMIPEGTIFVMGDNRNHSTDSRSSRVGLVDEKEVMGEVIFRLLPIQDAGPVR